MTAKATLATHLPGLVEGLRPRDPQRAADARDALTAVAASRDCPEHLATQLANIEALCTEAALLQDQAWHAARELLRES